MATLGQSIDLLVQILATCAPEEKRRYQIEYNALTEVFDGHPFDNRRYHHAIERGIYADARERADMQVAAEGRGELTHHKRSAT